MGGFASTLNNYKAATAQSFPPKPKFSTDQIPDLAGRVVIVTGGNTGIGKETVKNPSNLQALLEHNAKVYLAARSKSRADAAIADLKATTGKDAIFLELDLANLASVRRAAEEYLSKEQELHILFNNAGVMWCPVEMMTEDGYDMQFGTNVLGHFFFTELLMPALFAGVKSSPDGHARVVTTSSSAAYLDTLHPETFRDHPKRKKMGSKGLYFQSKFMALWDEVLIVSRSRSLKGNAVVAREVARRYADKGILSYSCNPGNLWTDLQRYASSAERLFIKYITYPASFGALTQLWGGTMPDVVDHNGDFLIPWARLGRCRKEVYDPKVGEELWSYLEEQVKDK
ncbi:hypothetical protein EW026_g5779 [Hermanssonia centrifuga]|uniref:NAD(P)-binding protein n=1 Tax=Hermanssonia centrifuga TaxID=98765 RepID=A0A4S4KD22_9APHY|nr:hypothetical protein EW026_g5779 [Hermanssonia centrifuga]